MKVDIEPNIVVDTEIIKSDVVRELTTIFNEYLDVPEPLSKMQLFSIFLIERA